MFTVYALQNTVSKRYYIGSTNDVSRRLEEHNRGQTKSTRQKGQWKLVYKEECQSNSEAKLRENKIKSYKSGNAFKNLIAGVVYR